MEILLSNLYLYINILSRNVLHFTYPADWTLFVLLFLSLVCFTNAIRVDCFLFFWFIDFQFYPPPLQYSSSKFPKLISSPCPDSPVPQLIKSMEFLSHVCASLNMCRHSGPFFKILASEECLLPALVEWVVSLLTNRVHFGRYFFKKYYS